MTFWPSHVCRGELESCRQILEKDPNHLGALEISAQALWYEENFEEVIKVTTRLIRLNPHEPGYRYTRGMAHLSVKNLKSAETDFKQALLQSQDFHFCEQVRRSLNALEVWIEESNRVAALDNFSATIH